MTRLFVNVDHVATIREARKTLEPDPLKVALLIEKIGVDGITVHFGERRFWPRVLQIRWEQGLFTVDK